MKVKDLLKEIEDYSAEYDDFLDWDVFVEQVSEGDRLSKKDWRWLTDGDDWEYIECVGYCTLFPQEKVITINVNY